MHSGSNDHLIQALLEYNSQQPASGFDNYLSLFAEQNYQVAFINAVKNGHSEAAMTILEIAGNRISDQAISTVFEHTAKYGHVETVTKILGLADSRISDQIFSKGFENAAEYGNTEIVIKMLGLAGSRISDQALSTGFELAVRNGHTEVITKIFELAGGRFSDRALSIAFEHAAKNGSTEDIIKILELAEGRISDQTFSTGFEYAAKNGHPKTTIKIYELAEGKISSQTVSQVFIEATAVIAKLLYLKYPQMITLEAIREASGYAITHSDKTKIKFLIENQIFTKQADFKLIGFANYVGQWSSAVIDYIKNNNHIGLIALSKTDTENKDFLAIFDGFINPGAGDTFPTTGAFDISYLSDGSHHRQHEYAYQNVINYAKEHSLPYLGLCNGAQHLILNHGGQIAKTDTSHNNTPHSLKVVEGSIIHFLAMNEDEQGLAVNQGYFPEMEFAINTQHNYAGVNGKIGDLELGGVSDAGVVEAVARKFYQLGFQFHPENMYNNKEDEAFGRNANLLKNTFKFFIIDKTNTDLDKMHDYLATELNNAYDYAKCYIDEQNSCPAPVGMVRDIFFEAMAYARIEG